ncbi:MAG: hypothetical protein GSR73_03920 [Desulfurococcales archaeon]|nr:hypothetical protein [Desulfurococcales archaeon]
MAKGKGGKERSPKKHEGEIGGVTTRLALFASRYSTPITLAILVLLLALGTYVRILPALKYGLELDANDPWIAYWEAEYFHKHGLLSFSGLSHVKEFWWPVGRDILHSDSLGVAWLAAATYGLGAKFGLSLKEWIALFPVFAGSLAILMLFLLVYIITRSKLAGLVSAAFFALSPGAITRTTVGFVEKTGMAVPALALFYIFLTLSLKHRKSARGLLYSVLAGLSGSLVGFLWGGYHLVTISIALAMLIDPLFGKPEIDRLKTYAVLVVSYIISASAVPSIGLQYFVGRLGSLDIIMLFIYALEVYVDKIPFINKMLEDGITPRFQAWLILVLLTAGFIAVYTGLIPMSLRFQAALGIRNISPLVESVQEHQPAPLSRLFREYGLALLFVLAGVVVFTARFLKGRYELHEAIPSAVLYFMALLLFYANKQLAYFTQMASLYVTIAAGLAVAEFTSGAIWVHKPGKAGSRHELGDPLRVLAGIFIVLIVGMGVAYYGDQAYNSNSYRAPQILTSGLSPLTILTPDGERKVIVPLNDAWLNALQWIKNNTRKDALVISWWDYGYWITVNTGRKTVADGSTFNETQIRALARLLTGDEGEANYLLRNVFKAEPNNTYIVFYEVFEGVVDLKNNMTILYPKPEAIQRPQQGLPGVVIHGLADFPKSIQMLRISYRIPPFSKSILHTAYTTVYVDRRGSEWIEFPGFVGQPQENATRVKNALIYKMAIDGISSLPKTAITDSSCEAVINRTRASLMAVAAASSPMGGYEVQYILPGKPFNSFKPVATSISCPIVNQQADRYTLLAVVVFIYQWTG